LINPTLYLPIILKALSLGQTESAQGTRSAVHELLGSTFVGGGLSILFWMLLSLSPTLWIFFLLTLLSMGFISAKMFGVFPSRFPPSFWLNTAITLFILVGPAVADSETGKDVYKAFAVRFSLFIAVSLYTWLAMAILEHLRKRSHAKMIRLTRKERHKCI
jgi:FtsH-binding integral membrane protein